MSQENGNWSDVTRRTFVNRTLLGMAGIAGTGLVSASEAAPQHARLPKDRDPRQLSTDFIPSELAAMERLATDFMAQYTVPGFSLAIAKDGKSVYQRAFGKATESENLTPKHVFRIASVTKPFTSATIMHLVGQGKLKRSDRVFGPEGVLGIAFGGPAYKQYVSEITVDQLLTHTSGGWPNDGADPMFRNPKMDHAELIRWTIENVPVKYKPGTHWAYSNFGYCILGRIIEKVTGMKYEEAVKSLILNRCQITNMGIAGNTFMERRGDEVAYLGQNGEDPYRMNVTRMDSHGGWLATPTDLVRFLVRMDGFPTVPDIMRPEELKILTTPTSAEGGAGYARGWSINSANNYWHNGSLPGTSTIMVRTAGGFCWAALTNTRTTGIDLALDQLIWNMTGKITVWPTRISS